MSQAACIPSVLCLAVKLTSAFLLISSFVFLQKATMRKNKSQHSFNLLPLAMRSIWMQFGKLQSSFKRELIANKILILNRLERYEKGRLGRWRFFLSPKSALPIILQIFLSLTFSTFCLKFIYLRIYLSNERYFKQTKYNKKNKHPWTHN